MGAPSKYKVYTKTYQEQAISYKRHLEILGVKKSTYQGRYLYLNEFLCFLESHKIFNTKAVATKEIIAYNSYLKARTSDITGKTLSESNIHTHLRNIQQFFGYLLEKGVITKNPASAIKLYKTASKPKRFVFNQEQITTLYAQANLTDKTLLNIAYGCGLRVQELSDLNKEDVRLQEGLVVVQKGKYNKRRIVPITKQLASELEAYLQETNHDNEAFFVHSKGERMQEWTFNKHLKKLLLKTDFGKGLSKEELNKIGIHSLRHSIATHLFQNGMKVEQVQTFLGHSQIETTETYTHISQSQLNQLLL